jgi:hypothetical protein
MNVIQIGILVGRGEKIDRIDYARQIKRDALRIGNGYCVLHGSSLDIVNGVISFDASPLMYSRLNDQKLFVVACMMDCIRRDPIIIRDELESIGEWEEKMQFMEKAEQYITLVQRSIIKFWGKP